jgi:hypothetical protein
LSKINEKVRAHVAAYCEKEGWDTSDEDVIEAIREGDEIWSGDESSRRWWNDCFTVVDVDGMLIGFGDATTTGDDSPADKGWEFDPSSICEVEAKTETKTTTTYIPIGDQ